MPPENIRKLCEQCSHLIKTSQLLYLADQATGFYMMGIFILNRLTTLDGNKTEEKFVQ